MRVCVRVAVPRSDHHCQFIGSVICFKVGNPRDVPPSFKYIAVTAAMLALFSTMSGGSSSPTAGTSSSKRSGCTVHQEYKQSAPRITSHLGTWPRAAEGWFQSRCATLKVAAGRAAAVRAAMFASTLLRKLSRTEASALSPPSKSVSQTWIRPSNIR